MPAKPPPPILATLPEPGRRARRRRAATVARVVARNFAPLARQGLAGRRPGPEAVAIAMRNTFEALGATFVKFGQLVASSPGVFGDVISNQFRSCLDSGPAVPFPVVREIVESTLGQPLATHFASFEETPIGRASIAVVHRAQLHDGRMVAVKVLRPGIAEAVATDLRLLGPLLEAMARFGISEAGQFLRMLGGFRIQLCEELDLRNEAQAMAHFRELLTQTDLPGIVVPEPYPALSGTRVLTMEFLDGVPFDDPVRTAQIDADPRSLMTQMVRGWFMTALRDGTFHGDVHAGNLLLLRDGRIGALDWGIVGRLDPDTHSFLRGMIRASLGDEAAWDVVVGHVLKAYGPILHEGLGLDDAAVHGLVRGMVEPMLTRPFGEASLGQFLAGMQGQVGTAEAARGQRRSWREIWRHLRRHRNAYLTARDENVLATDFERGSFLLAKQLMYFERYGKMYLADVAVLSDRAFFEQLLSEPPAQ